MLARVKAYASAMISAAALAAAAEAQETTLRLSSWLPPSHPIVKDMMVPWAEQVSEATDGRVAVQILDAPLGPPPAHFDLARNGVADLTFGVHGYTPGRFALTQIAELPFLTDSAEAASVAFWRVHEAMLDQADEHRGVRTLGVFVHGPGMLFTKGRAVSPVSELSGAKVRVAGSVTNQLAEALGMVSIQAPAPQSYEILSGGIADGIFFPAESIPFFKLDGLVDTALRAEGGLYNVSFFFVMNKAKYDALSDEDRAAIDGISGEAFARLAGKAWDAADAKGMEVIGGGVSFHDATDEETAALKKAVQPIYDGVAKAYADKGVDFEAALETFRAEAGKVSAE